MALIQRLKERKLVQWAIAYLAGAWVLFEVSDAVGGRLGWPDTLYHGFLVILAIGFFVTLVLAWYHGEKGRQRVSGPELLMLSTLFAILGGVFIILDGEGTPEDSVAEITGGALPGDVDVRPALAVLPFSDQTGTDDGGVLADGIHDELRTALSRLNGLKVFSPPSVDAYRDSPKAAVEIGRELGAGYLLEGSVRRAAEQIRLVVFLVDASDGSQLWASPYERSVLGEDLFSALVDVATRVAQELGAVISDDEARRIALRSTQDFQAFEAYMRGYAVTNDYVEAPRSRVEQGLRSLEEAVARDPDFALAHAALAGARGWVVLRSWDNSAAMKETARRAATRALELQPALPEAHYAMATYHYRVERDYEAALDELRLAEVGLRGDGAANLLRAYIHRRMGDSEAALAYLERARELDPRSDVPIMQTVETLMRARNWEDALGLAEQAIAVNPVRVSNGHRLARIRCALGAGADDLREYYRITREPYLPHWGWLIEYRERDWSAAGEYLDRWPASTFDEQSYFAPVNLLRGWTALAAGEREEAQDWFEAAERELATIAQRSPDDFRIASARAQALVGVGRPEEGIRQAYRALELMSPEADQVAGSINLSEVVLALGAAGDSVPAVQLLDSLFRLPFAEVPRHFLSDPRLDPLRGASGFQELVTRYWASGG